MIINKKELLKVMISACEQAGNEIRSLQQKGLEVKYKEQFGKISPVTNADIAANEIIKSNLNSFKIPIISEEGDLKENHNILSSEKKFFITDPLDGTNSMIKGYSYAVNLAYIEDSKVNMSVVYYPKQEKLFYFDGKNSFCKTQNGEIKKIQFSEKPLPQNVGTSFSKKEGNPDIIEQDVLKAFGLSEVDSKRSNNVMKFVNLFSSAQNENTNENVDLIISGKPYSMWDLAAPHGIVKGMGGEVFTFKTSGQDIKTSPLEYNVKNIIKSPEDQQMSDMLLGVEPFIATSETIAKRLGISSGRAIE